MYTVLSTILKDKDMSVSDDLRIYRDALNIGDFDTMALILEKACHDEQLNNAIVLWHSEHDEPIELSNYHKYRLWKLTQHLKNL